MRTFKAVFERDQATGFYVGYIPGFPGAHSQGATREELRGNLAEVTLVAVVADPGSLEQRERVVQRELAGEVADAPPTDGVGG